MQNGLPKMEKASWEDLRVLLAVSRADSFLHAGRALGVSTSTVARRILVLERQLQAPLVRRAASGTTLEPAAAPLVELAERIETQLAAAARDVGAPDPMAGTVRLALGEGFVRFGARIAAELRRAHPQTSIELVSDARMADLSRRAADLAVRTVKTPSQAVISRRLGELRYGLYASDDYLRRAGRRRLAEHDFVLYEGVLERQPEIRWLLQRGATRCFFRASNTDGVLEATLAGQGVAALPVLLAGPLLQRLRLDDEPPSKPVYLALHRDLRTVPRVRALATLLAGEIARALR
jgi:DNA-binding transcriptional LysR family regulator